MESFVGDDCLPHGLWTVIVIVGIIPIAIFVNECKSTCKSKEEDSREMAAREGSQRILNEWLLS